jgi:uncharacterized repeat protein (TIGR03803 family)
MKYKKFLAVASAALMIVIAVFMLTSGAWAQSAYKTLYKFKGGKDGNFSQANLIFDPAGNLYSTTTSGGAGYGTVFELTPNQDGSWTESVPYSFTGGEDGANPFAGLIFDQAGNLYGTTHAGGAAGSGTVFELTPNADGSWTESVLHSFTGSDGAYPVGGVILDAAENLYGMTTDGGASGNGTVFKLTPNGDGSWTENVLHSFNGGSDGSYPDHGSLAFDASGNLYGATADGGKGSCGIWAPGCGTIFELTPNSDGTWTEQVLHRFSGKDGANPEPTLIFDNLGNLYGTTLRGGTYGVGNVFELMPNGDGSWKEKVLHQFKGGSWGPWAGVTFDQSGNLYGTTLEGGNLSSCNGAGCGVVFKLTPKPTGGWRETVLHTFADHPGAAPVASLIFDAAGNLYGTTYGDGSKTFGSVFEITP